MLKSMSAGTRSLFALGTLVGLSAVTVLTLELENQSTVAEPVNVVEIASLASLPVDPEDFGIGADLEVRPATLKRRETLSDLVNRLDLPGNDGHRALYSLTNSELLNARRVRPGLEVKAHVEGDALNALSVDLEPGRRLMAKRMPGGEYKAFALNSLLIPTPYIVQGTIETSLYEDAQKLGAEDQQVVDFAQVFAYDLDFQREVHPGDAFFYGV